MLLHQMLRMLSELVNAVLVFNALNALIMQFIAFINADAVSVYADTVN